MDNQEQENIIRDSVLEDEGGYSTEPELYIREYPKQFVKINTKTIKSVCLYLQLLWNANPNGKTIEVLSILNNAVNLFGTRFETKDIYVLRHIASDLREIELFCAFDNIKIYFKNIELERADIIKRRNLSKLIAEYFSTIVHFNYISGNNSYEKIKSINDILNSIGVDIIKVPDTEQEYLSKRIFESIFEQISILFIMNYYEIFSEFLFDEDE